MVVLIILGVVLVIGSIVGKLWAQTGVITTTGKAVFATAAQKLIYKFAPFIRIIGFALIFKGWLHDTFIEMDPNAMGPIGIALIILGAIGIFWSGLIHSARDLEEQIIDSAQKKLVKFISPLVVALGLVMALMGIF